MLLNSKLTYLIRFFRSKTDAAIRAFFQSYFDAGNLEPLRLIAAAFIPAACDCKVTFIVCRHRQADPSADCDCNHNIPEPCVHVLNPDPIHEVLSPDVQTFLAWLLDSAKKPESREYPRPALPAEPSEVIERDDYAAVMQLRFAQGRAIQTPGDWAIVAAATEDQGDKRTDLARLGQPRRNNGTDKPSLFIAEADVDLDRVPACGVCREPLDIEGELCSACAVADRRLRRPALRPRLAEAA